MRSGRVAIRPHRKAGDAEALSSLPGSLSPGAGQLLP